MQPRLIPAPISAPDAGLIAKTLERPFQSFVTQPLTSASHEVRRIATSRRMGRLSPPRIRYQRLRELRADRHQSRLEELAQTNRNHRCRQVHVGEVQTQNFAGTQTSSVKDEKDRAKRERLNLNLETIVKGRRVQ